MTKALVLIDIQNDYFKDGKFPLVGMEQALVRARGLVAGFRDRGLPVIHVRHINMMKDAPFFVVDTPGAEIHPDVAPRSGEPVVVKHHVNSFRETTLKEELDARGVTSLVIAGAMSCMCVDAVTRAATDFGYACSVAHDACAAPNLAFGGTQIPAAHVHGAFMAALGMGYGTVASAEELLAAL